VGIWDGQVFLTRVKAQIDEGSGSFFRLNSFIKNR
jgi:hypothetical protein